MSYITNNNPSVVSWVAAAENSHILRLYSTAENTQSQFSIFSCFSYSLDSSLKSDWHELKNRIGLLTISIFLLALAVVAVYQGINIPRPFLYFLAVIMLGLAIAGFYQSKRATICEAYKNWKTTKKIIEFREICLNTYFFDGASSKALLKNRIEVILRNHGSTPLLDAVIINHEVKLFQSWIDFSLSDLEPLKLDAKDLLSRVVVFNEQYLERQLQQYLESQIQQPPATVAATA